MRLSDHDLLQLTGEELLELPEEVLRILSIKLLNDLKEARERLKQTSRNSSRPPSSDLPWDKAGADKENTHHQHDELTDEDDATPGTDEISQNQSDESHKIRRTIQIKPKSGMMKTRTIDGKRVNTLAGTSSLGQ